VAGATARGWASIRHRRPLLQTTVPLPTLIRDNRPLDHWLGELQGALNTVFARPEAQRGPTQERPTRRRNSTRQPAAMLPG
jgi:hypothetical protein